MTRSRLTHHWRTADDVACIDILSGPERGTPHSHLTFSIGVVLEGACRIDTGLATIEIPSGSILAGNPFRTHASAWVGPVNRHFIMHIPVAYWKTHGIRPGDENGDVPFFVNSRIDDDETAESLIRLRDFLERGEKTSAEHEIQFCVSRCAERYSKPFLSSGLESGALQEEFSSRIFSAIRNKNHTVNAAAAEIVISRYKFSRILHHQCGIQPRQLKKQIMLLRAGKMILGGSSLSAAAIDSGFSDQSHMSREFKKIYGITPKEFKFATIL